MAAKNQVTLTFAGDSDQLTKAMDKVGASSKQMADTVDKSSREVGDGFDRAGEAADNVDTKAMGFRDTMTGVQDTGKGLSQIMKGDLFNGFLTLGMGVGDLGSGLYNFLIPTIKKTITGFKGAATAAKAFTLSLLTNPVFLIGAAIALLVVGLVVLYKKSETARNIMNGAFRGIASVIAFVVIAGIRYFQGLANAALLVAEKVIGAFAKIPGPQQKALRAAANQIRSWRTDVNRNFDAAVSKVGELNRKIQGIPKAKTITVTVQWKQVGKSSISLNAPGASRIDAKAGGGRAAAGELYQVNERGMEFFRPNVDGNVIPIGGAAAGGPTVVNVTLRGSARYARALLEDLRDEIRNRSGGNVQLALGS